MTHEQFESITKPAGMGLLTADFNQKWRHGPGAGWAMASGYYNGEPLYVMAKVNITTDATLYWLPNSQSIKVCLPGNHP